MNLTNAIWLRHYLQELPPEKFHYMKPWLMDGCGCVSAHIRAHSSIGETGKPLMVRYLGITEDQAKRLYIGSLRSMWTIGKGQFAGTGQPGLTRAIACLDEIAHEHGINLAAECAKAQPQPEVNAEPFLAELRQMARELVGA